MKLTRLLILIPIAVLFAVGANSQSTSADTIAVIGTGDVGGALGPEFAALGHEIVYGSRNPQAPKLEALLERTGNGATAKSPAEAAAGADIVVLAVPGMAVEAVVAGLGDLSGKILIDPTNPLVRDADGAFTMGVETSNGQLIQALAPDAHVVKAFNTLNWRTMVDPQSAGGPVSIPLVGNNEDAKRTVAELVEGLGLEPIDLGPIEYAHYVEGMLILWINSEQHFDFHLRTPESN